MFDRNGLALESGLLAQMEQFCDGSAQFILSEIVLREVHRHLVEKAKNSKDELATATKRAIENGIVADNNRDELTAIIDNAVIPLNAAKARLEAFLKSSGVEIVSAETTDIRSLIKIYFDLSPPFEGSGKKKNEFPDAIALLSLEAWAEANNKKILAVSHDKGWADFASFSKRIDVMDDLPGALSLLQKDVEHAAKVMGVIVERLDSGDDKDLFDEIESHVSDEVSSASIFPDATSSFYFEPEFVELEFGSLSFRRKADRIDMDIVSIGAGRIVTRIGIQIEAEASTSFSFQVKDGIDKDYVSIGGCSASRELDFQSSILLTLEGDFSDLEEHDYFVSRVELIDMIDTVDFGEVEPDFGEDYYQ